MVTSFFKKLLTFVVVAVIVLVAVVRVCFSGESGQKKNDVEPLLNFLQLVFPECSPEFRATVIGLAADPDGYYQAHAAEFDAERRNEPYDLLYRDLLLAEMQKHNKLWTMDWKGNRSEINAIIEDLSHGKFVDLLTKEDGSDDYALADEQLPLASKRMREQGMILLCWDTDSDSYTLLVVPLDEADAIITAAAKCGIRIDKM